MRREQLFFDNDAYFFDANLSGITTQSEQPLEVGPETNVHLPTDGQEVVLLNTASTFNPFGDKS